MSDIFGIALCVVLALILLGLFVWIEIQPVNRGYASRGRTLTDEELADAFRRHRG